MTQRTREEWYDECIQLKNDGNLEQAISELESLTKTWPNYGLAHLALAVFYNRMGQNDASLASVSRACELEMENPFYFSALSALAIKCGNHEKAEEALMKAQEARLSAYLKSVKEQDATEDKT